ncbi:hypothetical protein VTL71DRAFT_11291 [Oculimacula yallundae]|uniref:Uncharacterized protein n=1 Tax=Oculimacula yallundae TaxID=86028 RepID=A0ABR4CRE3_9HELO
MQSATYLIHSRAFQWSIQHRIASISTLSLSLALSPTRHSLSVFSLHLTSALLHFFFLLLLLLFFSSSSSSPLYNLHPTSPLINDFTTSSTLEATCFTTAPSAIELIQTPVFKRHFPWTPTGFHITLFLATRHHPKYYYTILHDDLALLEYL